MFKKEVLNKMFEYKDGFLFWKIKLSKRVAIGDLAGTTKKDGRRVVIINKKEYKQHRIIYTMLKGNIPEGYQIDHKDRNPSNNNIDNLRIATPCQNRHNQDKNNRNTSGHKGIYCVKGKFWIATLTTGGNRQHLGSFESAELASEAYKKASKDSHGCFSSFE